MPSPIFRCKEAQLSFDQKGYAVIPLLDNNAVQGLSDCFDKLNNNNPQKGMVIGSISDDTEYKKESNKQINAIIGSNLEKHFINYEIFNSSFVFKTPKTNSFFPPHQDISMVDEEKYYSLNCWIPLVPISPKNGPIYVLPGSHYANYPSIRGSNIKYFFSGNERLIYQYACPIYVQPGQALILNHSLIHFSLPNYTNLSRKAIVCALTSACAPKIMYHLNNDLKEIFLYAVDEKLILDYGKYAHYLNNEPNAELISKFSYSEKELSKEDLKKIFHKMIVKSGACRDNKIDLIKYRIKNTLRIRLSKYL